MCVADGFIEGCRRQGSLRFVVVFVGLAIYTWGCCSRCSQSLYGGRCWQLEGMADFSSTCMFLFGCLRVRRFAIFQILLVLSLEGGHSVRFLQQVANHLDRAVSGVGRQPLRVLVQVNTSGEECRSQTLTLSSSFRTYKIFQSIDNFIRGHGTHVCHISRKSEDNLGFFCHLKYLYINLVELSIGQQNQEWSQLNVYILQSTWSKIAQTYFFLDLWPSACVTILPHLKIFR